IILNDVAARVKDDLAAVPDSRRQVLCVCSPGQKSLGSEDLNRSVFGYYLEQGLGGWADGYNPEGIRDGRVSVHELAAFLQARVDRWAVLNRSSRQTPVLLGLGEDWELVALDHGKARPEVGLAPATK